MPIPVFYWKNIIYQDDPEQKGILSAECDHVFGDVYHAVFRRYHSAVPGSYQNPWVDFIWG